MDDLGKTSLVGRTLAHYRISAVIGAGGMGEVYSATDTKLARDIAVKVLPSDMASDPDRLTRFQREARAVAALNHPNVVTVYSVEESENVHFITMELIEGQPLDRNPDGTTQNLTQDHRGKKANRAPRIADRGWKSRKRSPLPVKGEKCS